MIKFFSLIRKNYLDPEWIWLRIPAGGKSDEPVYTSDPQEKFSVLPELTGLAGLLSMLELVGLRLWPLSPLLLLLALGLFNLSNLPGLYFFHVRVGVF